MVSVIDEFVVQRKVVALTFDDGPDVVFTPQVLEVLASEDVPATFFVLGQSLNDRTDAIVRAAIDAGHEVGNHTFSHRSFNDPGLGDQAAREEIENSEVTISSPVDRRHVMRSVSLVGASVWVFDAITSHVVAKRRITVGCPGMEANNCSAQAPVTGR